MIDKNWKNVIDTQLEESKKEELLKERELKSLFESKARLHLKIHGKVQGVFFRDFVLQNAKRLDLVGWVKNIDDSVEVVAEGSRDKLDALVELCESGPEEATVNNVEKSWSGFTGAFSAFERVD